MTKRLHADVLLMVLVFTVSACANHGNRDASPSHDDGCAEFNIRPRIQPGPQWFSAVQDLEDELQDNWGAGPSFARLPNAKYLNSVFELQGELLRNRIVKSGQPEYEAYISKADQLEYLIGYVESAKKLAGSCFGGSLFEGEYMETVSAASSALTVVGKEAEIGLKIWEAGTAAHQIALASLEEFPISERVRQIGDIQYEISSVGRQRYRDSAKNTLYVEVSNLSKGRIVRPNLRRCWGYDESSPVTGGCYDTGFRLRDDYGNTFRLVGVEPKLEKTGIQPGTTVRFELRFDELIPMTVSKVSVVIEANAVGNREEIRLVIPRAALYPIID